MKQFLLRWGLVPELEVSDAERIGLRDPFDSYLEPQKYQRMLADGREHLSPANYKRLQNVVKLADGVYYLALNRWSEL